ncbi:MAG: hypothetical protein HC764_18470 [Pleurocapsa sp. CRU_1_2]|nr:hypothetical protein [Pleurocapsa sp. CRU_1_2]
MTYTAEKPTVQVSGDYAPRTLRDRQLITIEFAPKIHPTETEYTYEHPQFVFGDRVIITNHFPELEFIVCALELIESKTPSGKLLNQPRWKYKVSNGQVSYWKDESALVRSEQSSTSTDTCVNCQHFHDYHERNRGWCRQFDYPAKTNHKKTNDCIISFKTAVSHQLEAFPTEEIQDPANLPHSQYQVGSIVKIIDPDENYTEWAVFEVIECQFNQYIHDENNPKGYLNHVDWCYRLCSYADGNKMLMESFAESKSLWIAENEICDFNMAHNVNTNDMRSGIL